MGSNNIIQLPANMVIDRVEEDKIFLKPVFEDGDVLVSGNTGEPFIYNGDYDIKKDNIGCYIGMRCGGKLVIEPFSVPTPRWTSFCKARKATEQEKEKLFKVISDAGYVWDEQLKELKKPEPCPLLSRSSVYGSVAETDGNLFPVRIFIILNIRY